MIKKLHILVFRTYLGPFLLAFSVTLFLLVMQFLAMYMDEIAGKDLGLEILGKLFYYATSKMVVMALPIGLMSGALITFGGMGEHYELAAIKSCGINLFKISTPLILFAFLMTGFSMYLSFYTIPRANLKFFSLLYDVQRKKAEVAIKPGYFYSDIDGFVIRIGDKNKLTGVMYDMIVYNHLQGSGNKDVILADSARMMMEPGKEQLRLVLYHGARYEEYQPDAGKNNDPFARMMFDSLYYRMKLEGFTIERTDENLFTRHQITMVRDSLVSEIRKIQKEEKNDHRNFMTNLKPYSGIDSAIMVSYSPKNLKDIPPKTIQDSLLQKDVKLTGKELLIEKIAAIPTANTVEILNRAINNARTLKQNIGFRKTEIEEDRKHNYGYQYELWSMYAIPANCIIFMLIGISLGAIVRKGGLGLPSLISIGFFVIFYLMYMQGKKLSKDGVLEPWLGASLSIIVLTPVAIATMYQAIMDAKLIDESSREMWRDKIVDVFRRIFSMKKK